MRTTLSALVAVCALAAPARADKVGTVFPEPSLEGLAQTKAKTFDDFVGRTVLIEFFAYW